MAKNSTYNISVRLNTAQFDKAAARLGKSIINVGNTFKFTIARMASNKLQQMFAGAASVGEDFENQMARVKAICNATSTEFTRLNAAARKVGATTKYTSAEAGQALEYLTRNGLSAAQAIEALPEVMNFAGANAISLSESADTLTNVLNMYKMKAEDAAHVSDVFSNAARNSATNVTELYKAFVNVGPTAGSLGISLEETTGALMTLANQGTKAEDAGSKLAQVFSKMLDPKIQDKLKEYGINIDSDRLKTEGLAAAIEQFANSGMAVEDLVSIFGQRSWRGIEQLITNLSELKFNTELAQASAGVAAKMAEEGIGSVVKATKLLESAVQDSIIGIFEQVKPVIAGSLDALRGLVNTFGNFGNIVGGVVAASMVSLMKTSQKLNMQHNLEIEALKVEKTAYGMVTAARNGNTASITANIAQLRQEYSELLKLGGGSTQASNAIRLLERAEAELAATGKISDKTQIALAASIRALGPAAAATTAQLTKAKGASLLLKGAWTGLKAAGKGLLSFLGGVPGVIITIASIAIPALINAIKNTNKELNDSKKVISTTKNDMDTLSNKVEGLINRLGNDKYSLASITAELIQLMPDFAEEIKKGAIALDQGTLSAEKYAEQLREIVALQSTSAGMKANQQYYDALLGTMGKKVQSKPGDYGFGDIARQMKEREKNGQSKEVSANMYKEMMRAFMEGRQNGTGGYESLYKYLEGAGFDISNTKFDTTDNMSKLYDYVGKAADTYKEIQEQAENVVKKQEEIKKNLERNTLTTQASDRNIVFDDSTTNEELKKKIEEYDKRRAAAAQKSVDAEEAGAKIAKDKATALANYEKAIRVATNKYNNSEKSESDNEDKLKALASAEESLLDTLYGIENVSDEDLKLIQEHNQLLKDNNLQLKQLEDQREKTKNTEKEYEDILRKTGDALEKRADFYRGIASDVKNIQIEPSERTEQNYRMSKKTKNALSRKEHFQGNISDFQSILGQVEDAQRKGFIDSGAADKMKSDIDTVITELEKLRDAEDEVFKNSSKFDRLGASINTIYGGISGLYNGLNSIVEGVNSLTEDDLTGWEKFGVIISMVGGIIQAIESVISVIQFFSKVTAASGITAATSAAAEVAANATVQASEAERAAVMIPLIKLETAAWKGLMASQVSTAYAALGAFGIPLTTATVAGYLGIIAGAQAFAKGGIVEGTSYSGDNQIIRANSGEAVLTRSQQKRLLDIANGTGVMGANGSVEFVIKGKNLVGVANNYNKATSKIKSGL